MKIKNIDDLLGRVKYHQQAIDEVRGDLFVLLSMEVLSIISNRVVKKVYSSGAETIWVEYDKDDYKILELTHEKLYVNYGILHDLAMKYHMHEDELKTVFVGIMSRYYRLRVESVEVLAPLEKI